MGARRFCSKMEQRNFALLASKYVTFSPLFLCYIVILRLSVYLSPKRVHCHTEEPLVLHCIPQTTHFPSVLSPDSCSALHFTLVARVSCLFHHFNPYFPHFSCDQFPCTMNNGMQYYKILQMRIINNINKVIHDDNECLMNDCLRANELLVI